MEALYHQTNKLVQETQHLFSILEKKTPNLNIQQLEQDINNKINTINSNCEKLEILCLKVKVTMRQNAKMRVDQLKYDSRHLSAAFSTWKQQVQKIETEKAEREALLSTKFTTNTYVDIPVDHNAQYTNSLKNSVSGVDSLLQHGSGIIESLRSQRMTLKGAHRRLIDIGNTLGLSNTTMRLIEQRASQDCFILVGGMIFTVIVITIVVIYLL